MQPPPTYTPSSTYLPISPPPRRHPSRHPSRRPGHPLATGAAAGTHPTTLATSLVLPTPHPLTYLPTSHITAAHPATFIAPGCRDGYEPTAMASLPPYHPSIQLPTYQPPARRCPSRRPCRPSRDGGRVVVPSYEPAVLASYLSSSHSPIYLPAASLPPSEPPLRHPPATVAAAGCSGHAPATLTYPLSSISITYLPISLQRPRRRPAGPPRRPCQRCWGGTVQVWAPAARRVGRCPAAGGACGQGEAPGTFPSTSPPSLPSFHSPSRPPQLPAPWARRICAHHPSTHRVAFQSLSQLPAPRRLQWLVAAAGWAG